MWDSGDTFLNVKGYCLMLLYIDSYGFLDKIGGLLDPVTHDPHVFIKVLDELIAKGEKPV